MTAIQEKGPRRDKETGVSSRLVLCLLCGGRYVFKPCCAKPEHQFARCPGCKQGMLAVGQEFLPGFEVFWRGRSGERQS